MLTIAKLRFSISLLQLAETYGSRLEASSTGRNAREGAQPDIDVLDQSQWGRATSVGQCYRVFA